MIFPPWDSRLELKLLFLNPFFSRMGENRRHSKGLGFASKGERVLVLVESLFVR